MGEGVIQTGVDKLVKLVKDKGKISIKQASKLLGVDEETIEDWAQFLEDDRLISIEYKFTVPYLVGKKLNKEEMDAISNEIKEEKNIFRRKTESTMNYLETLDKEIDKMSKIFVNLEKHSDNSLRHVEDDIYELGKEEKEKERLDNQVTESKKEFIKRIGTINKKLDEENQNYKEISDDIKKEIEETAKIFEVEQKEAASIVQSQKYLETKLKEVRELSESIQEKMKYESKKIDDSEGKLENLKKRYDDLKNNLLKEKQEVIKVMNDNKLKEVKLEKMQADIIKKVEEKQKNIDGEFVHLKGLPEKLKNYMDKKSSIKKILTDLGTQEKALKEKLSEIITRSRALKIVAGKEQFEKEMKAMETDLKEISSKRGFFEEELGKLINLIKPKE